jgi:hypothetical protein
VIQGGDSARLPSSRSGPSSRPSPRPWRRLKRGRHWPRRGGDDLVGRLALVRQRGLQVLVLFLGQVVLQVGLAQRTLSGLVSTTMSAEIPLAWIEPRPACVARRGELTAWLLGGRMVCQALAGCTPTMVARWWSCSAPATISRPMPDAIDQHHHGHGLRGRRHLREEVVLERAAPCDSPWSR